MSELELTPEDMKPVDPDAHARLMKPIPQPQDFFMELKAILAELHAIRSCVGRIIPRVQAAANSIVDPDPGPVKMNDILKFVAHHFNLTPLDIKARRRTKSIARPRQIVMYLCRKMTARSLPEIGQFLGGKDHTTVIHSVKVIETIMRRDEQFAQEVMQLLDSIKSLTKGKANDQD